MAAKLVIEIEDKGGNASRPSATSAGAGGSPTAATSSAHAGGPPGQHFYPADGGSNGPATHDYASGTGSGGARRQPDKEAGNDVFGAMPDFAGTSQSQQWTWAQLDWAGKLEAAEQAGGKPDDVTPAQWERFQQQFNAPYEKAEEEKRKRIEKVEEERRQQEKERQARIDAIAKRREQEEMRDMAEARSAQATKEAFVTSSVLNYAQSQVSQDQAGGGKFQQKGETAGAAAGMAIGFAMGGPAGAQVGAMVGQEAGGQMGKFVDNPLPETYQDALYAVGRAADYAGAAFQRVAGNDGVGALQVSVNAASEALEGIPFVGKALQDHLGVFSKVVGAVNIATEAFANRARQISGYNGDIAVAVANQDVARLMRDLHEADQMGKGYAKLLEAQTRFEDTMEEILLPIKEWIVDQLPEVIDFFTEVLQEMVKIGYAIPGVKDERVKEIVDKIEQIQNNTRRTEDAVDELFREWPLQGGVLFGHGPNDPLPAGLPMGIPLLPQQ